MPYDPKAWMPSVTVRLPKVLDRRLRDAAKASDERVSDYVREAIRDRLNRPKTPT
jgi:predicted transcriptional regulator